MASPPSASTASGTRLSRPAARSEANIDGVVSIMSMPKLSDGVHQRLGVTLHIVADDVHGVPVEQGRQRLPGRIEGERPGVRHPQRAAEPLGRRPQHLVGMVGGVGQQRLMGSDDALGFSGGPGGEHDVGGLVRADTGAGSIVGVRFEPATPDSSASSTTSGAGPPAPIWRRISATRSSGIAGSSGTISRTRLEHCEHRHHVVGPAAQPDGDPRLGAHPTADQLGGQAIGGVIELAIAEFSSVPAQCHRTEPLLGGRAEGEVKARVESGITGNGRRAGRLRIVVESDGDLAQRTFPARAAAAGRRPAPAVPGPLDRAIPVPRRGFRPAP